MPHRREAALSDDQTLARIVQRQGKRRRSTPFPVHALCKLKVGSFKAFSATQELPIRPLTIIFGPNSAGKSSVLHSLLYMNEMTRNGEVDVRQPALGGGRIDIGGWAQAHNTNPNNAGIKFALEFKGGALTSSKELLGIGHSNNLGYGLSILELPDRTNPKGAIHQCHSCVTVDGLPIVAGFGHHNDEFEVDFDLVGNSIQDAWAAILTRHKKLPKGAGRLNEYGEDEAIMQVVQGISRHLQWVGSGPMDRWTTTLLGPPVSNKGREPAHFKSLGEAVANLSLDLAEAVADVIGPMRYHGPFREYRRRESFIVEPAMGRNRSAEDDAWDTLFHQSEVRTKVNAWMASCNTLETGYEVVHVSWPGEGL